MRILRMCLLLVLFAIVVNILSSLFCVISNFVEIKSSCKLYAKEETLISSFLPLSFDSIRLLIGAVKIDRYFLRSNYFMSWRFSILRVSLKNYYYAESFFQKSEKSREEGLFYLFFLSTPIKRSFLKIFKVTESKKDTLLCSFASCFSAINEDFKVKLRATSDLLGQRSTPPQIKRTGVLSCLWRKLNLKSHVQMNHLSESLQSVKKAKHIFLNDKQCSSAIRGIEHSAKTSSFGVTNEGVLCFLPPLTLLFPAASGDSTGNSRNCCTLKSNNSCNSISLAQQNTSAAPSSFSNSEKSVEHLFFDTAKIEVKGGRGGGGHVSFRREKNVAMGGPDGGNGGDGGNVFIVCSNNLNTLAKFKNNFYYKAPDGAKGCKKKKTGKKGEDIYISMPLSTTIKNKEGKLIGVLKAPDQKICVAKGGKGGRGNFSFKTNRLSAPRMYELGEDGSNEILHLELKFIADVALVGFPNSGKSTLLRSITNANPKIGDFNFTTIKPNLGVCNLPAVLEKTDNKGLVVVDIPGLLEGAHRGIGLGTSFLRHIEKVNVIAHMIDSNSPNPVENLVKIRKELEFYNDFLTKKQEVIILNKIDLLQNSSKINELKEDLKKHVKHSRIAAISALTGEGVFELMLKLSKFVHSLKEKFSEENDMHESAQEIYEEEKSGSFKDFKIVCISQEEGNTSQQCTYRVHGNGIERLVKMIDFDVWQNELRFHQTLHNIFFYQALDKMNVEENSKIIIGDMEFVFTKDKAFDSALAILRKRKKPKGKRTTNFLLKLTQKQNS